MTDLVRLLGVEPKKRGPYTNWPWEVEFLAEFAVLDGSCWRAYRALVKEDSPHWNGHFWRTRPHRQVRTTEGWNRHAVNNAWRHRPAENVPENRNVPPYEDMAITVFERVL